MKNFYKQCACHIAQCLCPRAFQQEIDPDELADQWEAEDQDRGTWH